MNELYLLRDEATGQEYYVTAIKLQDAVDKAKLADPSISDLELVDKIADQITGAHPVFKATP